jgi:hypothetical protein
MSGFGFVNHLHNPLDGGGRISRRGRKFLSPEHCAVTIYDGGAELGSS